MEYKGWKIDFESEIYTLKVICSPPGYLENDSNLCIVFNYPYNPKHINDVTEATEAAKTQINRFEEQKKQNESLVEA